MEVSLGNYIYFNEFKRKEKATKECSTSILTLFSLFYCEKMGKFSLLLSSIVISSQQLSDKVRKKYFFKIRDLLCKKRGEKSCLLFFDGLKFEAEKEF